MSFRNLLRLPAISVGAIFLWTMGHAQSPDSVRPASDFLTTEGMNRLRQAQLSPHALIYQRASALGDWNSAIYALHQLLLEDPGNRFHEDSLAALYLRTGNRVACLRLSREILSKRPDDLFILQLAGAVSEGDNDLKAALADFEALSQATKAPFYRYKVAGLQFQLGRYGECGSNIESMLTDAAIDDQAVRVDWAGGGAEIPLRAALLNLRGNLELALNKEMLARKSFREALKIAPDFVLARNNLNAIQEKYQQRLDQGGN